MEYENEANTKTAEPKDPAIVLLVGRLRQVTQQAEYHRDREAAHKQDMESACTNAKQYEAQMNSIKRALKKLGHKG